MTLEFPQSVTQFIGDAELIDDEIGMSPCRVQSFLRHGERFYLKSSSAIYAPTTYSVTREARVLDWLAGHLNVPEVVLLAGSSNGDEFMITRAVRGAPLSAWVEAGKPVLDLFIEAVRQLQAVSVDHCPFDASAGVRLQELEYLIRSGIVADDADLSQWPGLSSPEDLLARLQSNIPQEEWLFSHGDLCDSNLFVDAHENLHFIDLGRGGLADRWLDIAFVHRNLQEEISDAVAAQFLDALGEPDAPHKREFFVELDELF
nr:APH(3') family aminoglycoside O-phosphotransferase [Brucella intermedia]